MTPVIDTDRFSAQLRHRGVEPSTRRVAITRFDGSAQEQDLTEPTNCGGIGRVRHFRRATAQGWPENPLPMDPATRALGRPSEDVLRAQVFQNAICNWRCWYCYVDFPLLSANPTHSEFRTANELVDRWAREPDRSAVIDLTGGQPDLVPEWVAWMLDALAERGVADQVYLWSDDNLSNDYFFTELTAAQRLQINRASMYGKVCCFKGFDPHSFGFNTAAAPELFERQFSLMARLLRETTIDLYAYATFTSPIDKDLDVGMSAFVDRLQQLDPQLPLRTVPLQIGTFTPTRSRMTSEHERALAVQEIAVAAWRDELERRFSEDERSTAICDVRLHCR